MERSALCNGIEAGSLPVDVPCCSAQYHPQQHQCLEDGKHDQAADGEAVSQVVALVFFRRACRVVICASCWRFWVSCSRNCCSSSPTCRRWTRSTFQLATRSPTRLA